MMLRFHTQTGGSNLTAQQPLNNISRVTVQTLAAVLGGTQSLHTNGYDEALSLPTEEAARIALRTQQIVAFESGAPDTVDPLAGSYYVEALTNEVEQKATELIAKIDAMGGSVSAIEQGFIQDEIARSAYDYQRHIERGEKIIIRDEQTTKLKDLKDKRDAQVVVASLEHIRQRAVDGQNIMPSVVEAVEQYCTLGEIADVLRSVYGEYK
jgi:methylmalonyl-CoA mutase N-terminal domain/subunit